MDVRWHGTHGIGRFASELARRIEHRPAQLSGRPADPLDAGRTAWHLRRLRAPDVYFTPGYNAPLTTRCPFVLTVHDLNHIDIAESRGLATSLYYRTVLRRACTRATHVLTVSEFSRRRLLDWAHLDPDRVSVVGNGVSDDFTPEGPRHEPGYEYVLCVSNGKAHKNERRLVDAFLTAELASDVHLVLTGPARPVSDEAHGAAAERIHFTGVITDEELAALYRGATVVAQPSLYEGFGLPIAEAMACGTAVLTSRTTACGEIGDSAAELVDPLSVDSIRRGLERLVGDQARREQLIADGTVRAAEFRWEDVSNRARKILESA